MGNSPMFRAHMKSVKIPAFELFLHEMIPLAKAMGVGVEVSDDRALVLTAPKEQNKNSLNTAFGGSLVSLATLYDRYAALPDEHAIALKLFARRDDGAGLALKVYHRSRPIPLSDRVPMLKNFGFRVIDERTFTIAPSTSFQVC